MTTMSGKPESAGYGKLLDGDPEPKEATDLSAKSGEGTKKVSYSMVSQECLR